MTDIRLQKEHEHSLSAAARTWWSAEAGKINQRYRERRDERLKAHHSFFDRLRDRRAYLSAVRPRGQLVTEELASLEQQWREHKKAPLPDVSDLEADRLAAIKQLDTVLTTALRSIYNKALRGELDIRLEWSAAEQRFVIPEQLEASDA